MTQTTKKISFATKLPFRLGGFLMALMPLLPTIYFLPLLTAGIIIGSYILSIIGSVIAAGITIFLNDSEKQPENKGHKIFGKWLLGTSIFILIILISILIAYFALPLDMVGFLHHFFKNLKDFSIFIGMALGVDIVTIYKYGKIAYKQRVKKPVTSEVSNESTQVIEQLGQSKVQNQTPNKASFINTLPYKILGSLLALLPLLIGTFFLHLPGLTIGLIIGLYFLMGGILFTITLKVPACNALADDEKRMNFGKLMLITSLFLFTFLVCILVAYFFDPLHIFSFLHFKSLVNFVEFMIVTLLPTIMAVGGYIKATYENSQEQQKNDLNSNIEVKQTNSSEKELGTNLLITNQNNIKGRTIKYSPNNLKVVVDPNTQFQDTDNKNAKQNLLTDNNHSGTQWKK